MFRWRAVFCVWVSGYGVRDTLVDWSVRIVSNTGRVVQILIFPLSSQSRVNATIDDPSKGIDYQGFAPAVTSSNGNPILDDAIVASSQGRTLSYTATKSATATIYFTGKSNYRYERLSQSDNSASQARPSKHMV
jgi:hypothetical protein